MSFQAIETNYKGYRFRSRLEARWAVFFDTLGVPYEYERQGYHLEDGTRYLPDFWLPNVGKGCFVEIKPVPLTPEEAAKAEQLALGSGEYVMCFCGTPWPGEFTVTQFMRKPPPSPIMADILDRCIAEKAMWMFLRVADGAHDIADRIEKIREVCSAPALLTGLMSRTIRSARTLSWCEDHQSLSFGFFMEETERCETCGNAVDGELHPYARCFAGYECDPCLNGPALTAAFSAARSARFEHGETP